MNKSFIIERDVLTQVWVKQKFTIDAEDLASAVNKLRRTPKEEVYDLYDCDSEILHETEQELNNHININNCYEIPHQSKLNL